MGDNVATGAYKYLIAQPDVVAVVGSFPADDPDNAGVPWIFQRNIAQRMEGISIVKGTQSVALVCMDMGQSTSPMSGSTARFQRLEVDIWVDALRDQFGNVTNPSEARNRGLDVYSLLDAHLHRVAVSDSTQLWGDLVTTGSLRMTEPVWYDVPDGDGLIRGVAFYDVSCFGNAPTVMGVGGGDGGSGS